MKRIVNFLLGIMLLLVIIVLSFNLGRLAVINETSKELEKYPMIMEKPRKKEVIHKEATKEINSDVMTEKINQPHNAYQAIERKVFLSQKAYPAFRTVNRKAHYSISFCEGVFEYFHGDLVEYGIYECKGWKIYGYTSSAEYVGYYDKETGILEWKGANYRDRETGTIVWGEGIKYEANKEATNRYKWDKENWSQRKKYIKENRERTQELYDSFPK